MKTLSDYAICCTPEQTKKALELGAPIETYKPIIINSKAGGSFTTPTIETVTAEQMIGFFRDKNIHIVIHKDVVDKWSVYGHEIAPIEFTVFDRLIGFSSYKEAILAAIDAALEYLANKK